MPAPACYPAVLATYNAANNAACATMPATMQVAHYDNATAGDNAEREHRNDRGWEPCDNANQVTMPQAPVKELPHSCTRNATLLEPK